MFFKALMTVEGIGKQVSPDLDRSSNANHTSKRLLPSAGPETLDA